MVVLKFIFFLFAALFIVGVATLYSFINKVRNTARRYQERQDKRKNTIDGNTIYDHRSPEQSSKRIIPDNEGEYVAYEEMK